MENDNLEVLSQAEKEKLRLRKFKAAKKEAAVIILDD